MARAADCNSTGGRARAGDAGRHLRSKDLNVSTGVSLQEAPNVERNRNPGGNALRAAVLGANDGLVSNFCLIMGVSGAGGGRAPIVIAGLAGLLAGSISMALGEWLSVQSARELYANQLRIEATELEGHPDEEEAELQQIYGAKGLTQDEARDLARRIVRGDRAEGLDTMAREGLGINTQDPGG